jgi:hypothetical protein
MSTLAPYPVRVEGHLETPSRGLWLVKWLLLLPHYVLLCLLWVAMIVSSVAAFFTVLFTGRYPRSLFDFNLGVLRWTWRVAFYAYGANGTDRYPPFTLADVVDYPARLEIAYPETQRRGLPLIGWWLAGIPHYIVAGVFAGGGAFGVWRWGGLIDLIVLCAVVVLLFTGSYPRQLFDFVLGLNRWAIRVVAYAAVMTPEYPPFRVDLGEEEPGGLTIPYTVSARPAGGGRVAAGVLGGLAALLAVACLVGGGVAVVLDQTQRDSAGYLMTGWKAQSTTTYGLVSTSYRGGTSGDVLVSRDMLGTVRVSARSDTPVFVGVARARDVFAYLGSVSHEVGSGVDLSASAYTQVAGGRPTAAPGSLSIWDAKAAGSGDLNLTWKPRAGNWRIVLMNADASPGVQAQVRVGARLPHLLSIGIGLLGGAALLGLLTAGLIYIAARPERRNT